VQHKIDVRSDRKHNNNPTGGLDRMPSDDKGVYLPSGAVKF